MGSMCLLIIGFPTLNPLVSEDGRWGCDKTLDLKSKQNQDERNVRKELEEAMRTRTLEEEMMERENILTEYYDS